MKLVLVFVLSLCCFTAARYVWSDKPKIILFSDDLNEGETLQVSCTLPIDYRGGDCRLFRGRESAPFRQMVATDYVCVFQLTPQEVLGNQPVGSLVRLRCNYKLQSYTSQFSDSQPVAVWGSRPSPTLTVSRHFTSRQGAIEVTCSPPVPFVSSCSFYRGPYRILSGDCRRNVTGPELAVWEKRTLLLPVNLTCTYSPDSDLYILSEHSNHHMLFVVDASAVASSVDCKVSVSDEELEAFKERSWTSVGANRTQVTVHMTSSGVKPNETCSHVESQSRLQGASAVEAH